MKFKFKIQQYQSDAVESTVSVFAGQPSRDAFQFRRDLGKKAAAKITFEEEYTGYRNSDIELNDQQLLDSIRKIQDGQDIKQSPRLVSDLGRLGLDIEMETGTGKTYVYIKTMFELNKRYGWNKFIVVVPSIAIREGVNKSFTMLEDHFMEHYGKKARFFIYNSSNLQQLDSYSSDAGINVMIINTQAFAKDLNEDKKTKAGLIIYSERDDFGSRKPIDVIAANRPIIIMDEPQKMEGQATQKALRRFNPLFVLYYSATHKTQHNCIYALDALDAFKQKLVKKIQVKGFEVKNLKGTSSYLYLDDIILSKNQPPMVRIEMEVETNSGVKKIMKKLVPPWHVVQDTPGRKARPFFRKDFDRHDGGRVVIWNAPAGAWRPLPHDDSCLRRCSAQPCRQPARGGVLRHCAWLYRSQSCRRVALRVRADAERRPRDGSLRDRLSRPFWAPFRHCLDACG